MKNIITNAASLLIAAALAAPLAACSDKDSSSGSAGSIHSDEGNIAGSVLDDDVNVAQEDLPYGATVMQLTPENDGVPVITEFDYRFLSNEEGKKAAEYLSSLALKDVSLLEGSTYPPSLSNRLAREGSLTSQEFLDEEYELITSYTGGDFKFTYYLINNVLTEADTDFSSYDKLVLDSDPNAEITDRKYVEIECLYSLTSSDGSYSLTNRIGSDIALYVYTIDGGVYVLT